MYSPELFSLSLLTFLVILVPAWRRLYFFPSRGTSLSLAKGRIDFFDMAKGLSILAVILIHVSYYFYYDGTAHRENFLLLFLNNISRFCIPIFFICSGVLLRPWEEASEGFFKKKILRIFIPYFLAVALIALYYQVSAYTFVWALFSGKAEVPYYFIVVLFQLYLLYPLLSKYRSSVYLLPLTFGLSLASAYFSDYLNLLGFVLFSKYIFFFAYGIYMRDRFLSGQKMGTREKRMWLVLAMVFVITVLLMPDIYYNSRLFYGLAIFNLLYYYKDALLNKLGFVYNWLKGLGGLSLWLFLVHFQLGYLIYEGVIRVFENFYLQYFSVFFLNIVLSSAVAWVLKKGYDFFLERLSREIN